MQTYSPAGAAYGGHRDVPGIHWCRSCGADAAADHAVCGACGIGLDRPDAGPTRIGRVVTVPGRMLTKVAIVIGETDGSAVLLSKADNGEPMPVAQLDALETVAVPGPAMTSAIGRLWAANLARAAGTVKAKWPVETVDGIVAGFLTQSLGVRRAAALDAIVLDVPALSPSLGLTASELTWYAAVLADKGPLPVLLDLLERLPPQGYPGRVTSLLRQTAGLLQDQALAERARAVLAPLVATSFDALALHDALGALPPPDVADQVRAFASDPARVSARVGAAVGLVTVAMAQRQRMPLLPPTSAPVLAALDAYAAGLAGTPLDDTAPVTAPLPEVLLDDLIAAGALRGLPAGSPPWPPRVTSYLRCRLAPGTATAEDLRTTGFVAESARRQYLAGDDAALARLPAGDPAVAHFVALRGYRTTGRIDRDRLYPATVEVLDLIDGVRAPGAGPRQVPIGIAADPSSWPLLWDVIAGGETAPPRAYPAFVAWVALCEVHRLLVDGDWSRAATASATLAGSEARNLEAYARWRLGDAGAAARILDEALRERFGVGLAVNASILASLRGSTAALPYLGQIVSSAQDPAVRAAAVNRALDLWADDPTYPPELARLVRECLAVAQPDELHRRLLVISAAHDAPWLADARIWTIGEGQQDAVLYYRAVARARPPQIAAALVTIAGRQPRAAWVRRELTTLTATLNDAVHKPFGDALGVVPMIDGLLAGDVLALADRIVLSVRAAAHIAFSLEERQETITVPTEQRLVFEPVRLFAAREGDLSSDQADAVRRELATCVGGTAACVYAASARAIDRLVGQFNVLQDRKRWDQMSLPSIVASQRQLLASMEHAIARCQAYLRAMEGLPLNDATVTMRESFANDVRGWSAENARARTGL